VRLQVDASSSDIASEEGSDEGKMKARKGKAKARKGKAKARKGKAKARNGKAKARKGKKKVSRKFVPKRLALVASPGDPKPNVSGASHSGSQLTAGVFSDHSGCRLTPGTFADLSGCWLTPDENEYYSIMRQLANFLIREAVKLT
jgi:hypothetical protein